MLLLEELKEYQYILFKTKEGQRGRNFLTRRNILPTTAKAWSLGYCPKNFVPTIYKENKSQFNQSMLQDRIIIPVFNAHNRLISIGGRAIDSNSKTKYTNYPFSTARNLFGINMNYTFIREENIAIITEGQFDVISAWQKGIRTVVCSFGAHSGLEQIALLSRYTDNIHIVFDSDKAGLRGLDTVKKLNTGDINVHLHANLFPVGQDLDNWVQSHTKDDLYALLANENSIDTLQNQLLNQLNMTIE